MCDLRHLLCRLALLSADSGRPQRDPLHRHRCHGVGGDAHHPPGPEQGAGRHQRVCADPSAYQACWAAAEACPDRGETPAGGCGLERAGQWLGWSFRGPLRYCSCYSEGCRRFFGVIHRLWGGPFGGEDHPGWPWIHQRARAGPEDCCSGDLDLSCDLRGTFSKIGGGWCVDTRHKMPLRTLPPAFEGSVPSVRIRPSTRPRGPGHRVLRGGGADPVGRLPAPSGGAKGAGVTG
ncbi:unnamed protein product [Durusdinium trenchii]|uniref:Uncharacterized protein n=2 Tax=Durusdinium trenchii TaxID=1381693 RepID=A0ABP0SP69_9DINO